MTYCKIQTHKDGRHFLFITKKARNLHVLYNCEEKLDGTIVFTPVKVLGKIVLEEEN